MSFLSFSPDLVVEVTRACDRACAGCYAPNVLVKNGKAMNDSGLYLSVAALKEALGAIQDRPALIAVRGGEPSLNVELEGLLSLIKSRADNVVLETHGRWIIDGSDRVSLESLARLSVTVKVSFDSMHGLSAETLKLMLSRLKDNRVPYLVAITEMTEEECEKVARPILEFVSRSHIVFQKKVSDAEKLFKPRLGVIDTNGKLRLSLTAKQSIFNSPISVKRVAV